MGIGVGGVSAFVCGFVGGQLVMEQPDNEKGAFVIGLLMAPLGAIAGSIVGGIADLIAFLRERLPAPVDLGAEGDYRETTPSPKLQEPFG
jgi:hypothetical protein